MMMKKVFIIFFLLIILGGGFLYFLGGEEPVAYKAEEENSEGLISRKEVVDRDADGLADWEEEFWGSNQLKSDTDGDNTPDGQEVSGGRNPVVAGPNDKISDPADRLLALTRLAVNQKNAPLASVNSEALFKTTYQITDIKVSPQAGEDAVRIYGEQIRSILKVYDDPKNINEMVLTLNYIEKGETGNAEKLKQTTEKHARSVSQLLSLSVPKGAERIHLNLINGLARMTELSFAMSQIALEPAFALGAVKRYPEQLNYLLAQINNLNIYLHGSGLKFTKEESLNFSLGL